MYCSSCSYHLRWIRTLLESVMTPRTALYGTALIRISAQQVASLAKEIENNMEVLDALN